MGEPIDPEARHWYFHVVGQGRSPIVDTWWQTETGGILLSPYELIFERDFNEYFYGAFLVKYE